MARIFSFSRKPALAPAPTEAAAIAAFTSGFSIEVMPRTASKIEDFRAILPAGTRVYVAHIDGVEFSEMLATARRLRAEGFDRGASFEYRPGIAGARYLRRFRHHAGEGFLVHQLLASRMAQRPSTGSATGLARMEEDESAARAASSNCDRARPSSVMERMPLPRDQSRKAPGPSSASAGSAVSSIPKT